MTSRSVRFILVCEGSADIALVAHLQSLLVYCGASEVTGTAVALSSIRRSLEGPTSAIGNKIATLLSIEPDPDLWFIHRDADNGDYEVRLAEIEEGAVEAGLESDWVPVIPVRETEAWILLDEAAIRRVAGSPKGRRPLELPKLSQLENVSDPKKALEEALCTASGCQGNRLKRFRKRLGELRRILLEQLPVGGYLEEVPAWCRLKQSVEEFVNRPAV